MDKIEKGDLVMALNDSPHNGPPVDFHKGGIYEVKIIDAYSIDVVRDDVGNPNNGWHRSNFIKVTQEVIELARLLYGR